MADNELYAILGVESTATDDELRRAYRQLAMKWHPDRAGGDTTFIFQKLSHAYEVLADPVTRAKYDRSRPRTTAPAAPPPAPPEAPAPIDRLRHDLVPSGRAWAERHRDHRCPPLGR